MTETDSLIEMIQNMAEVLGQPGAICTGVVLICEWADSDERRLTEHRSESLTEWAADGMLQHALDKSWGEEE